MPQTAIVIQLTKTIAKATLVESIRDVIVDFLADQAKDLGKKEISDRIAKLRSDAKLCTQIQQALERATGRWATNHPDRDLVAAVAQSTTFTDLPSVQEVIRTVAQRPFDPIAAETLRGKFDDVLPQRFEPARVELGIAALLEFLREEFAGVSALQQAQQVAAAIQNARATEQIVTLLEQMLSGPIPTQETLTNYLTWVIDQHRYLDPRGVRQTVRQVQVLLQDVYVSLTAEAEPDLSAADRHLYEHELERMLARDDLQPEESEDLRENLLARYAQAGQTRPKAEPVDLSDLVNQHAKLVILGDPGAGKTTLLRYLALHYAQAMRKGENEIETLGPTRLPLYLRIAEYAEHGNGRALLDFLPTNIRGENDSDETLALLIREKLAQGTCLVLLDGLDEIIEPGQRAEIAAQIDALIRAHERAGNRFVVTSRVAGYRTAPLSGDIAHYRVRDMSAAQTRAFLEQWCHAVECFQTPDLSPQAQAAKAQAEIDAITQAIEDNPGVRALATNPLLLRILALIHRTGARLPQRRIELYRLAADTLIRDWQLARGISEAALVKEAEATRLLAELAAWLHQEKPAGTAAHGEVRAKLAEVKGRLLGQDPDHPDVLDAVGEFLRCIRQHTGLFVERAPRRYGFMHLTFEEYFAARWLVAKPRQAARRIRNKLHRPRWQEPILLAIGFYGMEFPDDVDDLIREAILGQNLGGPSPYEHILHRDLLFAVRCLGDQNVSAGLCRKLIADFTHCWLDQNQAGKYNFLRERCAQIAQALRGSEAETTLTESFIATLQNKSASEDVRGIAALALSNATTQPDVISALLAALTDESKSVRGCAASALSNATNQPGVVSALLTALTDESEDVRCSTASALNNATTQPDVVSALLALLQDKSRAVRYRATLALSNATLTAEAISALLAALTDENKGVRGSAASALINVTTQPDVVSALLTALQDKSEDVRSHAASALINATTQPNVVSALLTALQDKSEDVRSHAASALINATTQPDVVSALLAARQDKSKSVRSRADQVLRNAALTAEAVSALLAALQDKSESVRGCAAYALRNATPTTDVVSALLAALHDKSESVRSSAAYALSNATTQPDVVSALLALLQDNSEYVRSGVAYALRNATPTTDVVSALLAALHDKSESVRVVAAYALSNPDALLHNVTGQSEVISVSLAVLESENQFTSAHAALVLSKMVYLEDVFNVLFIALHDDRRFVRQGAGYILAQIVHQSAIDLPPDFPERLAASLSITGLQNDPALINIEWYSTIQANTIASQLLQALSIVAPPP